MSTVVVRYIKPSLLPIVGITASLVLGSFCSFLHSLSNGRQLRSYKLLRIMLIISFGVMLTGAKEAEFNVAGFILVMAAAIVSGFRWNIPQLLLKVSAEYLLISKASVIALTVAGMVKEVVSLVTIMVGVMFLRDNFTVLKGSGLGVDIIDVSLFNWLRYQKLIHGVSGEHELSYQNQNHSYVALKENHAVFEVGDELDKDILYLRTRYSGHRVTSSAFSLHWRVETVTGTVGKGVVH
ncbi:hypothetical protein R1sor_024391 [Riccia sorocarpa]|uniref:Uncharacterized protein n=1 Tax=Riccia sorocarpa TaxID=122646 RepID=A0ABD3GQD9_9MARC